MHICERALFPLLFSASGLTVIWFYNEDLWKSVNDLQLYLHDIVFISFSVIYFQHHNITQIWVKVLQIRRFTHSMIWCTLHGIRGTHHGRQQWTSSRHAIEDAFGEMHSHQELGITNRRRDLPSPKAGILVTINYQLALHSAILLKTELLGSGLNLSLLVLTWATWED